MSNQHQYEDKITHLLSICFISNICDAQESGGDGSPATPDYSQLEIPSVRGLTPLPDINTKIYIGTQVNILAVIFVLSIPTAFTFFDQHFKSFSAIQ